MPTTTSKLGLSLPYESDYYDISVQNGNFQKIDDLVHVTKSGTATSIKYAINSTTTQDGTVTWYYQKSDDGLIRAWTSFQMANLRCTDSQGQDGTWQSGWVHVNYPDLGQTKIINRNLSCGGGEGQSVHNWIMDDSTYGSDTGYQTFRLISLLKETSNLVKNIYLSFVATS